MSADHFTAKLPTKRMAADCLFTDGTDRLLILKPPYKPTWDLPGGAVERDESPRAAARREVLEEIGLVVEPGALLAVDWTARSGDFSEVVALLFDGGVLTPDEIERIVLHPDEAVAFRFVSLEEASRLLEPGQYGRVAAGRRTGGTAYLENGQVSYPRPSQGA
ncbi:NUDIX hydrolase [Kribbella sp.]|uniref:NUDIX hydrolase n=1 Tax=Kribbella sp. TaxID=1871183 RepID=UPI002D56EB91|nr:NUDIX hydrolase [Kribbella sp.]HZX03440.1 NUDIX hydrolase [Kribbella sp.]